MEVAALISSLISTVHVLQAGVAYSVKQVCMCTTTHLLNQPMSHLMSHLDSAEFFFFETSRPNFNFKDNKGV